MVKRELRKNEEMITPLELDNVARPGLEFIRECLTSPNPSPRAAENARLALRVTGQAGGRWGTLVRTVANHREVLKQVKAPAAKQQRLWQASEQLMDQMFPDIPRQVPRQPKAKI